MIYDSRCLCGGPKGEHFPLPFRKVKLYSFQLATINEPKKKTLLEYDSKHDFQLFLPQKA